MIIVRESVTLDVDGGYILYLTTNGESGGNAIFTSLPNISILRNEPCESINWTLSEDFKTLTIADNEANAGKSIQINCEG